MGNYYGIGYEDDTIDSLVKDGKRLDGSTNYALLGEVPYLRCIKITTTRNIDKIDYVVPRYSPFRQGALKLLYDDTSNAGSGGEIQNAFVFSDRNILPKGNVYNFNGNVKIPSDSQHHNTSYLSHLHIINDIDFQKLIFLPILQVISGYDKQDTQSASPIIVEYCDIKTYREKYENNPSYGILSMTLAPTYYYQPNNDREFFGAIKLLIDYQMEYNYLDTIKGISSNIQSVSAFNRPTTSDKITMQYDVPSQSIFRLGGFSKSAGRRLDIDWQNVESWNGDSGMLNFETYFTCNPTNTHNVPTAKLTSLFNTNIVYDELGTVWKTIGGAVSLQDVIDFCNSFAVYWTESEYTAKYYGLRDDVDLDTLHLGGMDDEGYARKELSQRGLDIKSLPQSKWTQIQYGKEPSSDTDTNTYIDKMQTTNGVNSYGDFSRMYILTKSQVRTLSDKLYNADDTVLNELIKGLGMYGTNPINAISSLRKYPFNVASLIGSGSNANIYLGRYDTEINAITFPSNGNYKFKFSGVKIPKRYEPNFLNYSPYTNIFLYVPYCGIHQLSGHYIGKEIEIELLFEFNNGTCSAVVYGNGAILDTFKGLIGQEIQICGDNANQYASNVANSILNTAGALATKNPLSVVSGILNISQSLGTEFNASGSNAGNIDTMLPQYAYIIIESSVPDIPSTYGHTNGYVANQSALISDLQGFTICENVDTDGFNITKEEKQMLKEILESGFYV